MLTKIGLDLGYANISICNTPSTVYREPSVALMDKVTHRVLALGNAALTAEGPTADEGILFRPFKNGMIFHGHVTDKICNAVLHSIPPEKEPKRVIIGVPSDVSQKENDELLEILTASGARYAYSVKRPIAALIGSGYSPLISAISVNIGAHATEIAVTSKGKILLTTTAQIGGEDFDLAVKDYIFKQAELTVSLLVARAIKEKIGAVGEGKGSQSLDIEGTLSLTGEKLHMTVTSEDIAGVFEKPMQELLSAIATAVRKIPLGQVESIFANGILLTGGGAQLYGIDRLIAAILGIKVTVPNDPGGAVARGLLRINLNLPDSYHFNRRDLTFNLARLFPDKTESKQ